MIGALQFARAGVNPHKIIETDQPSVVYNLELRRLVTHRDYGVHGITHNRLRDCLCYRSPLAPELIRKINRSNHGIVVCKHEEHYRFAFLDDKLFHEQVTGKPFKTSKKNPHEIRRLSDDEKIQWVKYAKEIETILSGQSKNDLLRALEEAHCKAEKAEIPCLVIEHLLALQGDMEHHNPIPTRKAVEAVKLAIPDFKPRLAALCG
jgi:hypothetical protein